jgi:hypothetical protein
MYLALESLLIFNLIANLLVLQFIQVQVDLLPVVVALMEQYLHVELHHVGQEGLLLEEVVVHELLLHLLGVEELLEELDHLN